MSVLTLKDIYLLGQKKFTQNVQFKSHQGNKVLNICRRKDCRFDAFCCPQQICSVCTQEHKDCDFLMIGQLKKYCNQKTNQLIKITNMFFDIEKRMINEIVQSRQQLLLSTAVEQQNFEYFNLISQIFIQKNVKGISGQMIDKLFAILLQKRTTNISEEYLKRYEQKIKQMLKALTEERQTIFNEIFNKKRQRSITVQMAYDFSTKQEEFHFNLQQVIAHISEKVPSNTFQNNDEQILGNGSFEPKPYKKLHFDYFDQFPKLADLKNNEKTIKDLLQSRLFKKELGKNKKLSLVYKSVKDNRNMLRKLCKNKSKTVTMLLTDANIPIAAYGQSKWKAIYKDDAIPKSQKASFIMSFDQNGAKILFQNQAINYLDQDHQGLPFGNDVIIFKGQNYGEQNDQSQSDDNWSNQTIESRDNFQKYYELMYGRVFKIKQFEVYEVIN